MNENFFSNEQIMTKTVKTCLIYLKIRVYKKQFLNNYSKLIAKKITKLNKLIKDKLRGSTQFFCLFGVNCSKMID